MATNKRLIKSNDEGGGVVPLSFNTVTYDGNNGVNPRTDVGFQPDLVWIKNRDIVRDHFLTDSVRGAGAYLSSNLTAAEDTTARFNSFDSNGFTVSTDTTLLNNSSNKYVAWCWKAAGYANTFNVLENGSTTSSATAAGAGITAGSITTGWSVSANRDAGFSIVSYTGNGVSGATIGHGLGVEPSVLLVKNRDSATNWTVYHKGVDSNAQNYRLVLNATSAKEDETNNGWNDTRPTSSVFSVGNGSWVNNLNNSIIAYCFAEVAGFSKFGSYVGSDGNVVTTGFEPAFVLIKSTTNAAGGWNIFDNKRGLQNRLFPNFNYAESPDSPAILNFTPTGFSFNTRDSWTNGSHTYIYMAFANQF